MNEPGRRQSRHRRRKGVAVQLTARDETVLHALARFRLARTSDIMSYAFSDVRRDTAAARLRRLFDSRHLAVLPPHPGVENVYRLGPAGRHYLAGQRVEVGRVPRGGVEHHLSIVQAWVAVAGLRDVTIERCLPDWELRAKFTVGELRIVPDLFMLLRVGQDLHAIAVEVDCGTESQAVLRRKLDVYRSLWGRAPGLFGWDRFGIVVTFHDCSRGSTIAHTLKNAWVVPYALWAAPDCPSSALRKLFGELSTPLTTTPYVKGSLNASAERRDA